jgi:hypothetical protein
MSDNGWIELAICIGVAIAGFATTLLLIQLCILIFA